MADNPHHYGHGKLLNVIEHDTEPLEMTLHEFLDILTEQSVKDGATSVVAEIPVMTATGEAILVVEFSMKRPTGKH